MVLNFKTASLGKPCEVRKKKEVKVYSVFSVAL